MTRASRRLRSHFGGSLEPIDTAFMGGIDLHPDIRDFLSNVGLPAGSEPMVAFARRPPDLRLQALEGGCYLRVGTDGGTDLLVHEVSGEVISVDREGGFPAIFVSSSLLCFLECLRIFATLLPTVTTDRRTSRTPDGVHITDIFTTRAPTDHARRAAQMRRRIRAVDPKALDPGCWWAIVLEQVQEGEL